MAEIYLTQGEYVHKHAWNHQGVDITLSAKVKAKAIKLSTEHKAKPRYKEAARGIKALTLPKHIWEKAYKILDNEA